MNEVQIVLEGTIDSFKPMGDIIQYEGTILKRGTWRGSDGNTIHYEDLNVLKESAPTFSGTKLVHGHKDKSRKSVRGFNSVAWFDGEAIKNRGYIFDPPTVKLINAGKYPIGQSMEATVFVDSHMRAQKIVGRRVAIGIDRTAVPGAIRAQVRNVRLEKMGEDNKFVDAFKEKLDAVMADEETEEKAEAIMGLFAELMEIPDAGEAAASKYVLLTDTKFAEILAEAKAKPDPKEGDDKYKDLETRLLAFEEAGKRSQIANLEAEIKKNIQTERTYDSFQSRNLITAYSQRQVFWF